MTNPPVRYLIQCCALVACQLAESSSGGAQGAPHAAPPRHAAFPKVSPDGRQVLFSRDSAGQPFLYVMNADGSNQRPVPGRFMPLSWYPDGKRLLVGIPGEGRGAPIRLATVNLDGTDLKEISTGGVSVMGGARLLGDGKAIVFAAPIRDSTGRQSLGLNVMDLADARIRRVSMPNVDGRLLEPPAPSPDGRRLAFVVIDTTDHTSFTRSTTLYVMSIDGTNLREVATLPNLLEHVAWSNDGRQIAVSYTGRTPPVGTPFPPDYVHDANVVVIDVESGVIRPIAHRSRRYIDELPSWSPRGYIYFQSDRDGSMEIYRMKPDGSAQERITGRAPGQ
jgi:Tol biopolymer transport system component